MIRPLELESVDPHGPWSCRACDVWEVLRAAEAGDAGALRDLFEHDPNLHRAEYWYTQPIHLAVREGHLEAVRLLLDAGADPSLGTLNGDSLVTTARDRGHEDVALLLEGTCAARARHWTEPASVACLQDPATLSGGSPLHHAVMAGAVEDVVTLLDGGAAIDEPHGAGPATAAGYAPVDYAPIDLALFWRERGDVALARVLLARGAAHDLVIAAALGDVEDVRGRLDARPDAIGGARAFGRRPLTAAVQFGREEVARLLLERGANPNWPEGAAAPRGAALHTAARLGHQPLVDLLLAYGADPNAAIDSSGSATWAAATPEIRARLIAHGGALSVSDLIWLDDDDEAVRRTRHDPRSADEGCGGAIAAACKMGKHQLLARLLDAGARVPPMLTACRSYLLGDAVMLRLLLDRGMDPNLPDWQHATPLHELCGRDSRGRPHLNRVACAALLLDRGATMAARDDHYRSTALGWAARCGLADMVDLLLGRGAPAHEPDAAPWATPLAWATRRGHGVIAETLRAAGAG